jgi:uncharacterized protein
MSQQTRLPLFPLPDVVHFPNTELRLHVFEPRYRRLVRDLLELDQASRWIGIVLLKPGWGRDYAGRPEIFPGGTAGLLVDVEPQPDGTSSIVLQGDFRFEVECEVGAETYREALVQPVEEPRLDETDPAILAVRHSLGELVDALVRELGESFPLRAEALATDLSFAELVNRIAADLDVSALRKLELLYESLPDRALSLLSLLRSRQQVLDLLRPFRHLAESSDRN